MIDEINNGEVLCHCGGMVIESGGFASIHYDVTGEIRKMKIMCFGCGKQWDGDYAFLLRKTGETTILPEEEYVHIEGKTQLC